MANELAQHIGDRSAAGIAGAVSRLIADGSLPVGTRLPTVRELARELGVSPTTVSEAWQLLAGVGSLRTRGRLGSFVVGRSSASPPRRFREVSDGDAYFPLDLSTGMPDPDLLPDLGPALARIGDRSPTLSYLDDPVLPELGEILRGVWPFAPEALTVVDGALDALDRLIAVVVHLGDRVVVENPGFPPLLDLLEQTGAEVIAVEVDNEGVVPDSLAAALVQRPVAVFMQPRAQNPTGASTTTKRAQRLVELLSESEGLIIEDDHSGDVSNSPLVSLGRWLPTRTVHIRSFSKSHGPDLRLAAVGGAQAPVNHAVSRRTLGPGWSSRILQSVLVSLLTDAEAVDALARARMTYAERRRQLCRALADRSVAYSGTDGFNLWVEVASERAAQISLAANGVRAAPGSPFLTRALSSDHLRLTISRVSSNVDELADLLAAAARGPDGRRTYRR